MKSEVATLKPKAIGRLKRERAALDGMLSAFDRAVEREDADAADKWLALAVNQIAGIERELTP